MNTCFKIDLAIFHQANTWFDLLIFFFFPFTNKIAQPHFSIYTKV